MLHGVVELAFRHIDREIVGEGTGTDEKGHCNKTGDILVAVAPIYYRPTEVETLLGDATKAREKLGWHAETTVEEMCAEMVKADYQAAMRDGLVSDHGFRVYNYHE